MRDTPHCPCPPPHLPRARCPRSDDAVRYVDIDVFLVYRPLAFFVSLCSFSIDIAEAFGIGRILSPNAPVRKKAPSKHRDPGGE